MKLGLNKIFCYPLNSWSIAGELFKIIKYVMAILDYCMHKLLRLYIEKSPKELLFNCAGNAIRKK
jgi:hypothetical protein